MHQSSKVPERITNLYQVPSGNDVVMRRVSEGSETRGAHECRKDEPENAYTGQIPIFR